MNTHRQIRHQIALTTSRRRATDRPSRDRSLAEALAVGLGCDIDIAAVRRTPRRAVRA